MAVVAVLLLFAGAIARLSVGDERPDEVPKCPHGASPLTDDSGEPIRCLPHHTDLCLKGLKGRSIAADDICCHGNRIDYYCCAGISRQDCPDYINVTVVVFREQREPFIPTTLFQAAQGPDRAALGPQLQSIRGFPPGPQTKFGKQVPAARGSNFSPDEIARAPYNPPPERPPPGSFPVFAPLLELNAPGPVIDPADQTKQGNGSAAPLAPEPEQKPEDPKERVRLRLRKPPPGESEATSHQQPELAFQDDALGQDQQEQPRIQAQPRFGFAGQPPGDPQPPAPQAPGTFGRNPEESPQWVPDPRNVIPPTDSQTPTDRAPMQIRGLFPPASANSGDTPVAPEDPRVRPQQAAFWNSDEQLAHFGGLRLHAVSVDELPQPTQQSEPVATTQPSQTLWKFSSTRDGWKPVLDSVQQFSPAPAPSDPNMRPYPRFPSNLNAAPPASMEVFQDDAAQIAPQYMPSVFPGSTFSIASGAIPNMKPTRFIGFSSPGFEPARRRLRRY